MTNYKYSVICPMLENHTNGATTYYETKDGWRFAGDSDGSYCFENRTSGETHFYPIAATFILCYRLEVQG